MPTAQMPAGRAAPSPPSTDSVTRQTALPSGAAASVGAAASTLKKSVPLPSPVRAQSRAGGRALLRKGAVEPKERLATSAPKGADVGSSTGSAGAPSCSTGGPSAAGTRRRGIVAVGLPACETATTSSMLAAESAAADATVSVPFEGPSVTAPGGALLETRVNSTVL